MMRGRAPTETTTPPPAPEEDDMEAAVEQDSQKAAQAGEAAAEQATPPMQEQLRPDTLQKLSAILPAAMERLTQGQVPADQVAIPPEASGDKLPGGASKWLLAVSSMVEQFGPGIPGLEQFAIAPEELATNDGIVGAAMKLDALSRDSKLVAAIAKGPGASPKQQPKAVPTAAQE